MKIRKSCCSDVGKGWGGNPRGCNHNETVLSKVKVQLKSSCTVKYCKKPMDSTRGFSICRTEST